MAYVIYKKTRVPCSQSYAGPTWDYANIRHHYREIYDSRVWAETLAGWLTQANPGVGFDVAELAT